MKQMKQQKGFTIIELVVVILLLGILTATALPRFMDVTTQAHDAVVRAVEGSLQTGVALFHASWYAQGQPVENTAIVGFGTGLVVNNAAGYPVGLEDDEITADAAGAAACVIVYNQLLQEGGRPPVVATAAAAGAIPELTQLESVTRGFIAYASAVDVCTYIYAAAAETVVGDARRIEYDASTGTVVAVNVLL